MKYASRVFRPVRGKGAGAATLVMRRAAGLMTQETPFTQRALWATALVLMFFITGGILAADDLPVSGITPEEREILFRQEVVIRGLDSHHGIRLEDSGNSGSANSKQENSGKNAGKGSNDGSGEFDLFTSRFEEVNPNFLYEAMFLLPVEPGTEQESLVEVKDFLMDIRQFEEIPYYSKRNENTTDLFEYIRIESGPKYVDGAEIIVAEQQMAPFEPYTGVSEYRLDEGLLTFMAYNRTPIYLKWMKGVDDEKLYISVLVKATPGRLFFYGLIGAKAFDFFGLFHGRLDDAFSGRADAVFHWFHREFVQPRLN